MPASAPFLCCALRADVGIRAPGRVRLRPRIRAKAKSGLPLTVQVMRGQDN